MGRRGYVAGAVAALVLLVVPLGLVPYVLDPLSAEDATSSGAALRPLPGDPAVAAAMSCADPAGPASELPTRAVAARMCVTDEGVMPWYAPQDSLYADLTALVGLLEGLEPAPESTDTERYYCTSDGGYGFDLRLAFASGDVVSIPGDTGGCSTVRVGGKDLVGSDEVLATFLDALAAQRLSSPPAADLDALPLACGSDGPFGDHVVSRIGDPRDLVTAVSCWRPNRDDIGPWRGPTPVPEALLDELVTDMREHTRRDLGWDDEPCRDRPVIWQDLVGRTRWGDVVVVRGVCSTYLLSDVSTTAPAEQEFWYPAHRAQRILDRLRR